MKKLLLILALPFLFSSCNKENIEPNPPANGVELTEVKLIISSDAPTLYASISYYDETGTQKNGSLANGAIVNIDATQPIYISASCGFTLYGQNGTTTTTAEGDYFLYIDNVTVDVKTNCSLYTYSN